MMSQRVDILVIVAHPDDAEMGVAGAVAAWTAAGKKVAYVICTNGDKGTSDRSLPAHELVAIREKEQLAAARRVGVLQVDFLGFPDQQLEDTAAFRELLVRKIRRFRPDLVVSMDPYRRYVWHRDHRIVGQVVLDAAFPFARDHLAYPAMLEEGLAPHKVKELLFFGADEINHHIDITKTFTDKLEALRCHASQIKEFKIADLEKWLRGRCEKAARGSDYPLAEAFHRVVMPE